MPKAKLLHDRNQLSMYVQEKNITEINKILQKYIDTYNDAQRINHEKFITALPDSNIEEINMLIDDGMQVNGLELAQTLMADIDSDVKLKILKTLLFTLPKYSLALLDQIAHQLPMFFVFSRDALQILIDYGFSLLDHAATPRKNCYPPLKNPLFCRLSLENLKEAILFPQPIVASDGFVYDKKFLQEILATSRKSPITNEVLTDDFTPEINLQAKTYRRRIENYLCLTRLIETKKNKKFRKFMEDFYLLNLKYPDEDALRSIAITEDNVECASLLLKRGNTFTVEEDITFLCYAVRNTNYNMAKLLIENRTYLCKSEITNIMSSRFSHQDMLTLIVHFIFSSSLKYSEVVEMIDLIKQNAKRFKKSMLPLLDSLFNMNSYSSPFPAWMFCQKTGVILKAPMITEEGYTIKVGAETKNQIIPNRNLKNAIEDFKNNLIKNIKKSVDGNYIEKPAMEIPLHFQCPITFQLFDNPVVISHLGYSCEKNSTGTLSTCPLSREPLLSKEIENKSLKSAIEIWIERQFYLTHQRCDLESLKFLLSEIPCLPKTVEILLDEITPAGNTLLVHAIAADDIDLVESLLKLGVNTEITGEHGATCFSYLKSIEMINLLMEYNIDAEKYFVQQIEKGIDLDKFYYVDISRSYLDSFFDALIKKVYNSQWHHRQYYSTQPSNIEVFRCSRTSFVTIHSRFKDVFPLLNKNTQDAPYTQDELKKLREYREMANIAKADIILRRISKVFESIQKTHETKFFKLPKLSKETEIRSNTSVESSPSKVAFH